MKNKDNMICPICGGNGILEKPKFKQKKMKQKEELAKRLRKHGYSIREIMRLMNYKSPRCIQMLLEK